MIRTKIICTIGPSTNTLEKMMQLVDAGMNVARLNFSHGSYEEHLKNINLLKEVRTLSNKPLAIMLDTKGPEIRLGKLQEGEIVLQKGQHWELVADAIVGNEKRASIYPPYILSKLSIGDTILFDDGYIASQVVEKITSGVVLEIKNEGTLKSGKGINIPNTSLELPAVTDKDIEDIRFGCREDVDLIAASFIRSVDHVLKIKALLAEENKSDILVIAKIENSEGVQHFDSIVQAADGIMIARGDLGVELPLSQVPGLQKMMIEKSILAGKPVITATQMLESMIKYPRPTRAEVSDVANAVYGGTSAAMLSGETAIGEYPIATVEMMKNIIQEAEKDFDHEGFFKRFSSFIYHDVASAVTLTTVKMAYSSNAQAIFVPTNEGTTPRLLSRIRPHIPIIAMTDRKKTFHQLALSWGVVPYFKEKYCKEIRSIFENISQYALEQEIVSYGDLVVMTAVTSLVSGTTNMMILENIGDVLVRGHVGYGSVVRGRVIIILCPETTDPKLVQDQILVISRCDETYLPLIQCSSGVILQNSLYDLESEKYAKKTALILNKPLLIRADAALHILKQGQLVTLDPQKSLVYKGDIKLN